MPATPRPALTRAAIVDVAISLADAGGLPSVTMRAVAGALGVEAMSLYHHVADKRALLDAAAERVWSGVAVGPAASWQDSVRAIALSAHDVLIEHAWVLDVASSAGGVERMRVIEALLEALTDGGLSPEDVYEGYHLIDALILGYTAQEASYSVPADPTTSAASIPEEMPHVRTHASAHRSAHRDRAGSGLRAGVDIALEALERRARVT